MCLLFRVAEGGLGLGIQGFRILGAQALGCED